jgi:hypothetical protein
VLHEFDIPVLVHELQHFTTQELKNIGRDDDEVRSYFMGYYTNKILDTYNKKKK